MSRRRPHSDTRLEVHAFRRGQIEALIWAGFNTTIAIARQLQLNEATVRWHMKRMPKIASERVRVNPKGATTQQFRTVAA